ncbi:hypothetical protein GKD24_10315 [Lactobacillus paracasei]|uniref:Uncharacterized protein n=1 Tax=Lacticaseibacillus paracasei (strain ATCC 334 / BCRC 17002 / CCUG 31169 / CIP 107868 / KCTC 3260 / NRRL B-441) TaxID=321967 RepID=Q03D41_LACP3|nr:hypothetical protein LSEI_0015 [Lacticaseibacillus paracasei ATCC 334]MCT3335300.1 hypothetical protein [Lacticaseibacillus paracasei]PTS55624.1 hypothetical protein DBQ61_12205 [Lactobacillus sp. DS22_6]MSC18729.1 hypothetical protein [Lacticaseibacillus paracasei]MSC31246.1 hypothetical protein [Lacticaseibacillus paracasei]
MLQNRVFKLIFWVICGLINIIFRILIGDTFEQSMLNILTVIPFFWIIVITIEITVAHFSAKDHL